MDTTHTAPTAAALKTLKRMVQAAKRKADHAAACRDAIAPGREQERRAVVAEVAFSTYLGARSRYFAAGGIL